MEVIKTQKLEKIFIDGNEEIRVLRGIDFVANAGEFVSITGASGTGKSTLIYQLGLLDDQTSGEVFVKGINSKDMSVKQKTEFRLNNFGFVFQDYALLPELNAWENVALPSLMRGLSLDEAKQMAVEALQKFGMGDRINHTPDMLSGGENQRVSIARAIAHKPSILFADEPTANLDSDRSRQIIDIFHQLYKNGQTIIMITHEIEYAREASRFIELKDGVIYLDEKMH